MSIIISQIVFQLLPPPLHENFYIETTEYSQNDRLRFNYFHSKMCFEVSYNVWVTGQKKWHALNTNGVL